MFGRGPRSGGVHSSSYSAFPQVDRNSVHDVINQFSSAISYWKAVACPCHDERSGQPALDCANCRGLGWFHTAAETGEEYQRAMVHSRQSKEITAKGGTYITGYASITLMPGVVPGDGDIIQCCKDIEVINNEHHTVGSKLTDGSSAEALRFRDIKAVEKVLVWDVDGKKLVSEVPSNAWEFVPSERLVKLTSAPVGLKYSVRYRTTPEYVVLGQSAKPLNRVTHDDGLPDPLRTRNDIVYPFNVSAIRLDRAIASRQRGAVDLTVESTFNSAAGKGPFR